MDVPFNVVLIEPEIPQNTGSIGRLCLATGSKLHLVEPLGFEITDSHLKRAGLDYWEHLKVLRHASVDVFLESIPAGVQKIFLTKKAGPTFFDIKYEPGAYLIFGKETAGLSDQLLNRYAGDCVRIPMFDARVRSINLSNAVSVVVYEGIRQIGFK